jgi:hypothetical protein
MRHVGFSQKWMDWTSTLLSTAITRVCLNGAQGNRICHAHDLRQGDPLSPMLFVLVIEVLDALIRKANDWALFSRFGVQSIRHRTSLYADDFIMFISPTSIDLGLYHTIFQVFEEASGLGCNLSKCQMAPIRCTPDQILVAASAFPCQIVDFPIKYLGIPLSVKKLPRSVLQPLADKVADKLLIWQGKLMHQSGILVLIKTTLSSISIYTSISIELPPWLLKCLVKLMKAFLWSGQMRYREESA